MCVCVGLSFLSSSSILILPYIKINIFRCIGLCTRGEPADILIFFLPIAISLSPEHYGRINEEICEMKSKNGSQPSALGQKTHPSVKTNRSNFCE